jgi:enoyl-CoA hydratase/carnithine racemase
MTAPGGLGGSVWSVPPPNVITGLPLWKPLIAAVNGYCIGAGCMFALACDVRIASENAEFGIPEIQYGFPPGLAAPQRLPRVIALGPALEMLLTGDRISAQQALQWALVNRVVPQASLMDAALELAGRITRNPPLAVRATKELVYRGLDMRLEDGVRMSGLFGTLARDTEDAQEGGRAFREKRKPEFKGR